MAALIRYPETVQYRQMAQEMSHQRLDRFLKNHQASSILKFTGTVKLHGVNAAIGYQRSVGHWCQSRNRVITTDQDNVGFANHIDRLAEKFLVTGVLPESATIRKHYEEGDKIIIFGEWCGGNIQPNVALCLSLIHI